MFLVSFGTKLRCFVRLSRGWPANLQLLGSTRPKPLPLENLMPTTYRVTPDARSGGVSNVNGRAYG